jgi:hypothetical protein
VKVLIQAKSIPETEDLRSFSVILMILIVILDFKENFEFWMVSQFSFFTI